MTLRIGEFSRLARVSVKVLRHYDRMGLLEPARTDDWTGYRYYSSEQLTRLNVILSLKELGFSAISSFEPSRGDSSASASTSRTTETIVSGSCNERRSNSARRGTSPSMNSRSRALASRTVIPSGPALLIALTARLRAARDDSG